jgi:SpoVK/Ycf46/Vps4 family AAA+-type ATPase
VNPGVRVLLVGESGTGKTLAASWLATALGAPLYRVDLAAVMNKYIGESEKNLGALLDQAAANDVVLLFDEADSLFGRRSDRKETGERYANMLTNFLLTRIESHPGLVLLTTNSRERIDAAFTRRLDQILEVPLPGFEEGLRLWHSHLGGRSPGAETCRTLAAYCELTGGQIRNVVLTAAALASEPEGPLGLGELIEALRGEYRKSGRALPPQIERLDRGPERGGSRGPRGPS